MEEFTIESTSWDKVKLFWEKWKQYDITVKTYGLNLKNTKIYYENSEEFYKYEEEKTFGFYKEEILIGCCQIKNFTDSSPTQDKIAGICNMAVNPAYRNNGIGSSLTWAAVEYIDKHFELCILYPSLYSQEIKFYGRFGFIPYKDVMLKYFNRVDISLEELDKIIEDMGKF